MKPILLLAIPLGKAFEANVADYFDISTDMTPRAGVEALVTVGNIVTDGPFMDGFPNLKIIACFGSGYENIDITAAKLRNIKVTNTVGANASTVADLAVGLLLASMRNIVYGDQNIRAGQWRGNLARMLFTPSVTGRHIGIIGMGAIGRKIGERMAGFETKIGYFNRSMKVDLRWRYFPSALKLATWADVLIIAHRADDSNRHMVNAEVIKALGKEGHIINIAHGNAIDEDALIAALKDGTIAGAGLDVFQGEPNVRPEFLQLNNVVLTPHIGGGTREAFAAMSAAVVNNIMAMAKGRALPNEVT
ncbi:MAG: NAD(P)-dependent oxidoreductase [Parvibaculum sp.]|nr:NAD(P)-dependent oxidoreductase [Parvibaculum sp.]